MFVYTYKIIQSSWGIFIKISGDITLNHIEIITNEKIKHVDKTVYLSINNIKLSEEEYNYIFKGIKFVINKLDFINFNNVLISININIIETDYQIEALYPSIANWMLGFLGQPLVEFKFIFDPKINKYLPLFEI